MIPWNRTRDRLAWPLNITSSICNRNSSMLGFATTSIDSGSDDGSNGENEQLKNTIVFDYWTSTFVNGHNGVWALLIPFVFKPELSLSLVSHRLARQKAAVAHINHCSETYQLRILIHEWNLVAQQARRTRDYFDRLERGEENQQNHGFVS